MNETLVLLVFRPSLIRMDEICFLYRAHESVLQPFVFANIAPKGQTS